MSLPALATVAAMEVRLGVNPGSLSGLDLARAEAALADASTLVRGEADRLWLDSEGNPEAPDAVALVVVQSALRAYRNPEGYTGESVDGYSWQGQQGETTLYLTAAEKLIVRAAVTAGATAGGWSGTGTVRTPSAYEADTTYPYGELPL